MRSSPSPGAGPSSAQYHPPLAGTKRRNDPTPSPELAARWSVMLSAPIQVTVAYPAGEKLLKIDHESLRKIAAVLRQDEQDLLFNTLNGILRKEYEFLPVEGNEHAVSGVPKDEQAMYRVHLTHDEQANISHMNVVPLEEARSFEESGRQTNRTRLALDLQSSRRSRSASPLQKRWQAQTREREWESLKIRIKEELSKPSTEGPTPSQAQAIIQLIEWCKEGSGDNSSVSLELILEKIRLCHPNYDAENKVLENILEKYEIVLPPMTKVVLKKFGIRNLTGEQKKDFAELVSEVHEEVIGWRADPEGGAGSGDALDTLFEFVRNEHRGMDDEFFIETCREIFGSKLPVEYADFERGLVNRIAEDLIAALRLDSFSDADARKFETMIGNAIALADIAASEKKAARRLKRGQAVGSLGSNENLKSACIGIYKFLVSLNPSLNITRYGKTLSKVFEKYGVSGIPAKNTILNAAGGGDRRKKQVENFTTHQMALMNDCLKKCAGLKQQNRIADFTEQEAWNDEVKNALLDFIDALPDQTYGQFSILLQQTGIIHFKMESILKYLVQNQILATSKLSELPSQKVELRSLDAQQVEEVAERFSDSLGLQKGNWNPEKEGEFLKLIKGMAMHVPTERAARQIFSEGLAAASAALWSFCQSDNPTLPVKSFRDSLVKEFGQNVPSDKWLRDHRGSRIEVAFSSEEVKESADQFKQSLKMGGGKEEWGSAKKEQFLALIREMKIQAAKRNGKGVKISEELQNAILALWKFCVKEEPFMKKADFVRCVEKFFDNNAPSSRAMYLIFNR